MSVLPNASAFPPPELGVT